MQGQQPESALERLWRKRAEYDARKLNSQAAAGEVNAANSFPMPAPLTVTATEKEGQKQLPVPAPAPQTGAPPQPADQPQPPQNLSSSSSVLLAKRVVLLNSSAARHSQRASQNIVDTSESPSIAAAAFRTPEQRAAPETRLCNQPDASACDDGHFVSGISIMGSQSQSTVRRLNQSAMLQRTSTVRSERTLQLVQAVARNDFNAVNSMLQQGLGSIDDTDSNGNSKMPSPYIYSAACLVLTGPAALCHVACMNNSSESLQVLFQHGAQPTQANRSALLPLHVAASQESVECVQLIIRRFPHVKKLRGGRQQWTALQIAQAIGAAPLIMQCLADGLDDFAVGSDVYAGPMLDLACSLNKAMSSTFKKLEAMITRADKLQDVKAVFDSIPSDKLAAVLSGRTDAGMTLLHCACKYSRASVVLYLINSRGFKCDAASATGDSAFHIAVSRVSEQHVSRVSEQQQSLASIRVLQAVLSCAGAEWITVFNSAGLNPLHLAVRLCCVPAVQLIINSCPQAILCCTENTGQNIIHLAAQNAQLPFVEFLLCCVKEAGFSPSSCSLIQDKRGRSARSDAADSHQNGGKGQ
jgi:ankyrin repeat protein